MYVYIMFFLNIDVPYSIHWLIMMSHEFPKFPTKIAILGVYEWN
jgi:hypothetical protein